MFNVTLKGVFTIQSEDKIQLYGTLWYLLRIDLQNE